MPPRSDHATASRLLAVILAGGRGSRMADAPGGSVQKGLVPLAGRPMIAHVLDRLAPQVSRVVLNVNGSDPAWAAFGLPLIADPEPDFPGPLAGLAAGLHYALTLDPVPASVIFVPTDTPFLPRDLAERLIADDPGRVAVAEGPGGLEPAISAVPTALAADLTDHLASVRAGAATGSIRAWLMRHEPRIVRFHIGTDLVDPFTNVNTPDERAAAERRLTAPRQP